MESKRSATTGSTARSSSRISGTASAPGAQRGAERQPRRGARSRPATFPRGGASRAARPPGRQAAVEARPGSQYTRDFAERIQWRQDTLLPVGRSGRTVLVPEHHLQAFTEHIHWLPPYAPTDRPALGLITGRRETLLVDAGASAAHARLLLDGVAAHRLRPPTLLHLTHWHWDHVFAGGSFAVPTFASRETRRIVTGLATLPWDDAALDARVTEGTEIPFCRDMIRAELPDPNRAPARSEEHT